MIQLEKVSKSYGSTSVVTDIDLCVEEGETVVLLGPSGSGKTTVLRLINGLVQPDSGTVSYKGQATRHISPHLLRRNMGYIIQDVGLFPHMTIAQNIQMPAKIQRKKILPDLVAELLQLVGLDTKMGARYPRELSGGQQQRIGIARALAGDPEVILMDEPFSALDNLSRIQLQNDFLKLDHLIRKTVVMVTHDIYEAFKLGDRIAILNEGKLQQIDTPANLLLAPANQFVAGFLKNDSLLLRLHNTPIKDLNTPEDMSLFEALESSAISTEQKLQLMRTFFEMQQQQAHE